MTKKKFDKKKFDKKKIWQKKLSPPGRFEPLDLRFKGERSNHYAIAAGLQIKAKCADYKLYALLYALVYVLKKSENIVTLAADNTAAMKLIFVAIKRIKNIVIVFVLHTYQRNWILRWLSNF